jgi:hypothetical protein
VANDQQGARHGGNDVHCHLRHHVLQRERLVDGIERCGDDAVILERGAIDRAEAASVQV